MFALLEARLGVVAAEPDSAALRDATLVQAEALPAVELATLALLLEDASAGVEVSAGACVQPPAPAPPAFLVLVLELPAVNPEPPLVAVAEPLVAVAS